ncbi:MAG: hypothetical protein HC771_01310 [Synechococcales cyanobacterium CRU_2_2]|nr:hypothetical protein [Synechococcales cyanobacterium CRU_2_2]
MAPNELVRRIKQAPRPFGLFHFGLFHFGLFQCGLFAFAWGAIALPATAATIRYDLSGQLSELTVQGQPTDQVGSLKPGDRLFGSFSYDDAIDPVATYGLEPGQVLLTDLRWGNGTDFLPRRLQPSLQPSISILEKSSTPIRAVRPNFPIPSSSHR